LPFLRSLGFLFGSTSAHALTSTRTAIYEVLHDSLLDEYNDQIRNLLDDGLLRRFELLLQSLIKLPVRMPRNEKLKHAIVALRDRYRVPEESAAPPDLLNLQENQRDFCLRG